MPSKFEIFDRSRLRVLPLEDRVNDLQLANWLALDDATPHSTIPILRKWDGASFRPRRAS